MVCVNADCNRVLENYSLSGWARVPFCAGKQTVSKDYTFGIFIAERARRHLVRGKQDAAANAFLAARGGTATGADSLRADVLRSGDSRYWSVRARARRPEQPDRRVCVVHRRELGRVPVWRSAGAGSDGLRQHRDLQPRRHATNLPCDGRPPGCPLVGARSCGIRESERLHIHGLHQWRPADHHADSRHEPGDRRPSRSPGRRCPAPTAIGWRSAPRPTAVMSGWPRWPGCPPPVNNISDRRAHHLRPHRRAHGCGFSDSERIRVQQPGGPDPGDFVGRQRCIPAAEPLAGVSGDGHRQ